MLELKILSLPSPSSAKVFSTHLLLAFNSSLSQFLPTFYEQLFPCESATSKFSLLAQTLSLVFFAIILFMISCRNWLQVSISPKFYKPPFRQKIITQTVSKASKKKLLKIDIWCQFHQLFTYVQLQRKSCSKSTPGVNFTNFLRTAFTLVDPKSIKNTVKSSVSFYAFGICEHKSCTENVDEIDTWFLRMILLSSFLIIKVVKKLALKSQRVGFSDAALNSFCQALTYLSWYHKIQVELKWFSSVHPVHLCMIKQNLHKTNLL